MLIDEMFQDHVQARFAVVEADLASMDRDIKDLQAGQSELREDVRVLREDMHALQIGHLALAGEQREMHTAIQELAAGQRQIFEILIGKPRQND